MGARGPIAEHRADVIQLRGNPGKRPPAKSIATKAPASKPNPPANLKGEGLREWKRILPQLDSLGILNKVDRGVLVVYCRAWARFVELEKIIDDTGLVVDGHRGVKTKNPAWQMWRESAALCTQLAKDIGCTPAARLRMTLPGDSDAEDGDEVLD